MSNTPQIRFAGFTDAWEQRKLGEVCQINGRIGFRGYTEKDIIPKEQGGVLAFTPTNIVNNQLTLNVRNTYITRVKYDESPEIMVKNGNILFVKTGSTLGKSALVTGFTEDSTVNPQVVVIKTDIPNQKILSTILTTDKVQSQVASVKIGGAVPTMTETELKNIELSMPINEDERIKIGAFFSKLDNIITLHQRKCDALQKFKKSMLQKMFPQNGESVPEIRFAGFTDAWEQRKLGDLAVEVKRKADKDSDAPVMMISASEGFIDQSQRYSNNNAGSSLKNYTLLYEGELAYNHGYSKFRNFGSVFDLKAEKARIPFVYHSFALPEDDHRFFAYYLNSGLFDGELKKLVSSTARMDGLLNISYEDYMSIHVLRPPVQEQEIIGRFLTSLDSLITLHQRKLETLQKMKKSLLQKMFV